MSARNRNQVFPNRGGGGAVQGTPGKGERQVTQTYIPPTCDHCGGIGHRRDDHDVHIHPASERLGAVVLAHAAELRALAKDIENDPGPIGASLTIARLSRSDAYRWMAERLERDANVSG